MNVRAVSLFRREGGGFLTRVVRTLAVAICAAAFGTVAIAQDDLPGRVGRVADVAGELFIAPQDKPDGWTAIGVNYPVTNGDNLWVGNDGRAEVDFGGGQFRLAGDTNLHMSRLDDREFALFVAQGRVSLRVRVLDPGESARIDTPNAQIAITRPGLYRVDVSPDREHTHVIVREGEVNVLTASAVQQVLPGQSADIDGTDPRYATVQNGIGIDGFDEWVANRDRRYGTRSANYVSPQMVGAADLGQYGTWSQTPDLGAVWYPNDVPGDWAPYRNGYWVDVGGWGPTWVDYAPWGYAPFHYGRWAYVGGRWGWTPGAYVARPRWAPAFVAWTGGAGWAISTSVGAPVYGWVPLGWGEPYRPWWGRCSYGCWERYNRPYAVNVAVVRPNSPPPTHYRNWNAPGGITAVSSAAFTSHQPVQQNLVRVPRDVIATTPVMATAPAMRNDPSRVAAQRPSSAPPPASTFQPTIARQAPAPFGAAPVQRGSVPSTDPGYSTRSRQSTPSTAAPPPTGVARQAPTTTPAQQPYVAPTTRQPASQPQVSPAPQAQGMPQGATQPTRSRSQPVPQQPQQAQAAPVPPAQPAMRAQPQSTPVPPAQPAMRAQPQSTPVPPAQPAVRAQPQPIPQPRAAPQAAPVQRAAPQPVPQPVAPQAVPQQPQPRQAPDGGNTRGRVPDNPANPVPDSPAGGGDGQRRSR